MQYVHAPPPPPPPPQQQQQPLHFLPVPRPLPPGAKSHREDVPFLIWFVVLLGLAAFSTWYALFYAHDDDMQLGGALAAGAFAFLALVMFIPVAIRRSRRGRLLAYGRAVPGAIVHVTNVQMVTSRGHHAIGTYQMIRIAFEDKEVRVLASPQNPNPPVFVEGRWAGIFQPVTPTAAPRVERGKWYLRRAR